MFYYITVFYIPFFFFTFQQYCSWEILYLRKSKLRTYHKCVKDWLLRWHQWEMAWLKGFVKCRDYIIKFLNNRRIPSDNAASERGIRKLKIKVENFLNIYIWRWSRCFLCTAFHLRHCTEKPALTNQCYQHHPLIVGWEIACAYCWIVIAITHFALIYLKFSIALSLVMAF